jgi:hypothetical protein
LKARYGSEYRLGFQIRDVEQVAEWVRSRVRQRPPTESERAEVIGKVPPQVVASVLSTEILTDEGSSIAFDFGLYLGEVVRSAVPHSKWGCQKRQKITSDYLHAVVFNASGKTRFPALSVAEVLTYKLIGSGADCEEVRRVCEIWIDDLIRYV